MHVLKEVSRRIVKLATIMKRPASRRTLLRFGVAAATEHNALSAIRVATVVDVGANHGQFSLAMRDLHPKATIIAFEPFPSAADVYRRVFANCPNVTLNEAAISPCRSNAILHVSKKDDSSSLLPISEPQTRIFPGTEAVGVIEVAAGPLADYVTHVVAPALLKIDVQGFELEVLRASENLLPQFEHVYVEASFIELYKDQALAAEVIDYLQRREFDLVGVYNVRYSGRISVQADFLFRKKV